ncbi:MAG: VOC family protein [Actinomycetota bacterium]|nr:VOC family protein [Acidimicrobiia bacterium]MDQ3292932.1 VOC family protein [Actinomycetota bacterium]
MRVTSPDHIVLMSPDPERLVAWYRDELGIEPERLEEWRAKQALFVSLRVNDTFIIDVLEGERSGTNVDHVAFVVEGVDLDELAASGRFDIDMGPADLFGARGTGRGLYFRDPDGNKIELRTYPAA